MKINILSLEVLGLGFKIVYRHKRIENDGSLKTFYINKSLNCRYLNPYIFIHIYRKKFLYSFGVKFFVWRE